jgi:flagellar hook assembly protein FlgD
MIGPSSKWNSIFWKHTTLEQPTGDTTNLEIQLFDVFGNYKSSIDTTFSSGDSILNLSNLVSADTIPFIKVVAKYTDTISYTPSQLKYWQVLYDGVPEAAIDASNGYVLQPQNDTLQEGQIGRFAVDIKNISSLPMDSLLVKYYILDQNQVKHFLNYPRQDSLLVASTLKDTVLFDTKGLVGNNWFCMEVNPYVDQQLTELDQPELSHINNILQFPFTVVEEFINPLLDVTFNGRHILNEDIVSPTTEILISLKDENPFLIMDSDADTSLFGVYITDPDGILKRVPFMDANGNTVMEWIPANSQNKRFKINFPTYFEKSGTYSLLVQGSDKSGNLSGDLEYKIDFEVIHESMITQIMNYPNPFSTSTRFVFTLTGDYIPDDFQIQIMTVTGKVVREIDEVEFGPMSIGRNISEFAWDGRDQFGDLLANGVYLYRVKAKINGEDIKRLESGADAYFNKEIGKMYLIR